MVPFLGGLFMLTSLIYYGHSCFRIETEVGWSAVLDPYADGSVPGLKLPHQKADTVYCSHEHSDHNAKDLITIVSSGIKNPYEEEVLMSDHDEQGGALRGKNRILILQNENEKLVHLGDLGSALPKEYIPVLADADILMIPCGGHYTIDAVQARELIRLLHPKTAVLMHYRSGGIGYDVLSSKTDVMQVMGDAADTGRSELCGIEPHGIVFLDPHPDARQDGENS